MNRSARRSVHASSFPIVLLYERERRGWSQRQLGEFLGVTQSCVARWEKGTRSPTIVELTRLGHLLGVTWKLG